MKSDFAADLCEKVASLTGRYGVFGIEISFVGLVNLIANLQLALRHPANRGYAARNMRKFVDDVISDLDAREPGIGDLLRRGDDPAYDVRRPCSKS